MIFPTVLDTEFLKLRRCKITWISFLVCASIIAVLGAFMWISMNPELAGRLGLIGQKANIGFGGQAGNWSTFLLVVCEMGGIMGMLLCSVILAFVFGREYAEGTAKNMLALPVGRGIFVAAKVCVAAIWYLSLVVLMLLETYIVGLILGLPGYSAELFGASASKVLLLSLMAFLVSAPTAWVAVAAKGYFAPLGYAIATIFVATIFGHTGWGRWVPWSIVGLYSGASGPATEVGLGSWVVVASTFIVGYALTFGHEKYADNTQ